MKIPKIAMLLLLTLFVFSTAHAFDDVRKNTVNTEFSIQNDIQINEVVVVQNESFIVQNYKLDLIEHNIEIQKNNQVANTTGINPRHIERIYYNVNWLKNNLRQNSEQLNYCKVISYPLRTCTKTGCFSYKLQ
jgi:hypothetical protein